MYNTRYLFFLWKKKLLILSFFYDSMRKQGTDLVLILGVKMSWWKEEWGHWLFTQIKGCSVLVEEAKITAVCIYKKDLEYVIKNGPYSKHYEKLEALMKEKTPCEHDALWIGFEWLKEEHEIGLKTTDADFFNKHFKKRAVSVIKKGSYLVEVTDDL